MFNKNLIKDLKSLRKVVQPQKKTIHLTSRVLRTSTWLLTYCFFWLRLSPNFVSLMSIVAGISAGIFAISNNLTVFSILCILWAVLDCCDGELARLRASRTEQSILKGSTIEIINSNIQYSLWLPCIAIGLFAEGKIDLGFVAFVVCSSAGYSASRFIMNSDFSQRSIGANRLKLFFASQTKNGEKFRDGNLTYMFIYILWRNTLTQFGIFPLVWLFVSLFPSHFSASGTLAFFSALYMSFSVSILLSLVLFSNGSDGYSENKIFGN